MPIRLKILAVSSALLVILCVALVGSVRLQHTVHKEIGSIVEYHIPLTALIGEIDIAIFEYELNLSRLLRQETIDSERLNEAAARDRALGVVINTDFDRLEQLIARGIVDARSDPEDKVVLSRLRGSLTSIKRDAAPFEALGADVLEAARQNDIPKARRLMQDFARYYHSFGPDLAEFRSSINQLTQQSMDETLGRQGNVELFSLVLFLVAAAIGLVVAGLMATRIVAGLLRLVAGARAVEAGTLLQPIPVRSRDEVGQLTRAFNHMIAELRLKERIKDIFGKYVDPKIVAKLIGVDGEAMETAERRVATIFFSDIQGFSGISEQLTASAVTLMLNRYFTLASDAIRARNGIIDKFIGDAVMAFWTQPFTTGDAHAAEACLAALAQQQAIVTLRAELPNILGLRRQVPDFAVRMGIATGDVVVGTIGAENARTYTVIGDTVNLASRLEGSNKVYGTRIMVAESTFRLGQTAIEAREIDLITVAGKTEPVRIYEVMAAADGLDEVGQEIRTRHGEGLAAYRAQNWDAAEAAFRAVLAASPADGPATVFLDRIAKLRAAPPPAAWDGVWRLTEK
ncbi:MAG: HAMP domain-containing protein [Proteobacteria bacterium]|nr:HAMP domain-containing protein [Pseudomonadota bacterium]